MHSVFEWAPVTFVLTSGKLSVMCTRKHFIILYELFNEYYNFNSICTINFWISSRYVLINPWIHYPNYWKAASIQYISCPNVWLDVENGFFIGNWISINLFEFLQSVNWNWGKKISVLANIGSELFVDFRCFIICELNNRQYSSRKLLFLVYQYPSETWQYMLASCT